MQTIVALSNYRQVARLYHGPTKAKKYEIWLAEYPAKVAFDTRSSTPLWHPELQRLSDVVGGGCFVAGEVRDRARDLADPIVGARAQPQP